MRNAGEEIDLKGLEAYLAVSTLGSVTAAAKSLKKSQPAVSRLIQELERNLGYELFERVGPRLSPTAQGLLLIRDVERAVTSVQQIRERAESIARGRKRPLRIASISAMAFGLLPSACLRCADAAANGVDLQTALPEEVRHAVVEGQVDVGLTSLPLDHRDLDIHWIGSAPCVLAMSVKDPLAEHEGPVRLSDLRERTFIATSGLHGLPARIRAVLARNGLRPKVVIRTNSSMNALAFIREGAGIGILEPVTVSRGLVDGVVIRPLDANIPFYFGVITPKSAPPDEQARALIDALAAVPRDLLRQFEMHHPDQHENLLAELYAMETIA
jgi:DNA-binding transcriptional LysR family regulator